MYFVGANINQASIVRSQYYANLKYKFFISYIRESYADKSINIFNGINWSQNPKTIKKTMYKDR